MSADTVITTDDLHCPHCNLLCDDPEERPTVGDLTICAYCTGVGIYTEDSIRKVTDEEMEDLNTRPGFRKTLLLASLTSLAHAAGDRVVTTDVPVDMPGHEGHVHRATVIALGSGDSGEAEMPSDLSDIIASALRHMQVFAMADEIKTYVTPEIAHHVLSAYGNEDASMPSIATAALISLIRLCHESDDVMLSNLNEVQDFHGYVIGVVLLAEKPDGLKMLAKIAGLETK